MSTDYYAPTGWPTTSSSVSSYRARDEMNLISQGFDKAPVLSSNNDKVIFVNSTGTALESKTDAAARAALGLAVGTDVLFWTAHVNALAGLTNTANEIPRFTSATTADTVTFHDEDTMISNDASGLASQQSIKAYADTQFATLNGALRGTQDTACLFYQATAPTGWTIISGVGTYNGRVVMMSDSSGTASGGSVSWLTDITSGNNTANHSHKVNIGIVSGNPNQTQTTEGASPGSSAGVSIHPHTHSTSYTGYSTGTSVGSHNHVWPAPAGAYCMIADKD